MNQKILTHLTAWDGLTEGREREIKGYTVLNLWSSSQFYFLVNKVQLSLFCQQQVSMSPNQQDRLLSAYDLTVKLGFPFFPTFPNT